eukprot:6187003-Pleurochrysis_carterae.AAC.1
MLENFNRPQRNVSCYGIMMQAAVVEALFIAAPNAFLVAREMHANRKIHEYCFTRRLEDGHCTLSRKHVRVQAQKAHFVHLRDRKQMLDAHL